MSRKMLKKEEAGPETVRYTKQQLLSAERYRESRDLLTALLDNNTLYSFQETDNVIEEYKKGMVK